MAKRALYCPRLPLQPPHESVGPIDSIRKFIRLLDAFQPNGNRWNSRFRKLPGKSNGKSTVPRREVRSIKKVRSCKCFELWPEFKHQFWQRAIRSIIVQTSAKHWSKARNKPKIKHKRWNILEPHIRNILERTYRNHICETYWKLHILETYPKLETHHPCRSTERPPAKRRSDTDLCWKKKLSSRQEGPGGDSLINGSFHRFLFGMFPKIGGKTPPKSSHF